jgi:hypothetical protein
MPIIVVVLGVIIVGLGAALFLIPAPVNETPVAPVAIEEEVNRTESMEQAEEQVVEADIPEPTAVTAATFTEKVSYLTPARTEHKMDITLTVDAGVVTDASIVYDEGEGFSNQHQERFDAAYKAEVIGKTLSEISLSRVGGASLTTTAFNDAVAKIAAQQS